MTLDEIVQGVMGVIMLIITGVGQWVVRVVHSNRETAIEHRQKLLNLEARMESMEKKALSKDDVREIMEQCIRTLAREGEKRQEEQTKRIERLADKVGQMHDDLLVLRTQCVARICGGEE